MFIYIYASINILTNIININICSLFVIGDIYFQYSLLVIHSKKQRNIRNMSS